MDAAKLNSKIDVPADALKILAELSQEINASLNLDEVLPNAAKLIKRLVDYEIFAVILPEEGTDQMYFRFAIGHRKEVVDHWRIPMGEGIIGAAAATGQAVRVGDVRSDPRYLNALDAVRSELAVPLIVRGRVIGVLDIESNELDYFTPYQQTILTLAALVFVELGVFDGGADARGDQSQNCLLIGREIIELVAFDVQDADDAATDDQRDGQLGANGIEGVEVARVRAHVANANGLPRGGSGADDAFAHGDAPVVHNFGAMTDGETEIHLVGGLVGQQHGENFVINEAFD